MPQVYELAKAGDLEQLKQLKQQQGNTFNPNEDNGSSAKPIHAAILKGQVETALWLIRETGADINAAIDGNKIANYAGYTALFLAIVKHNPTESLDMTEVVKELLSHDGTAGKQTLDIDARLAYQAYTGYTVLLFAIVCKKEDLVKLIIDSPLGKKILFTPKTNGTTTPLEKANQLKSDAIVALLNNKIQEIAQQAVMRSTKETTPQTTDPQPLTMIKKPPKGLYTEFLKYFQRMGQPYKSGSEAWGQVFQPAYGIRNIVTSLAYFAGSPLLFITKPMKDIFTSGSLWEFILNTRDTLVMSSTWLFQNTPYHLIKGVSQIASTVALPLIIPTRLAITYHKGQPKVEAKDSIQTLVKETSKTKQSESTKQIIAEIHRKYCKAIAKGQPSDIQTEEQRIYQLFSQSNSSQSTNEQQQQQQYLNLFTPK